MEKIGIWEIQTEAAGITSDCEGYRLILWGSASEFGEYRLKPRGNPALIESTGLVLTE